MSSTNTSTQRQWIAEQAREHPARVFTTLHRFIDLEWMQEAYRLTRKDGAAGIDGVTAPDYAKDLEANLLFLLGRIKSGSYCAPPVRRHNIPKADGTMRPLGGCWTNGSRPGCSKRASCNAPGRALRRAVW